MMASLFAGVSGLKNHQVRLNVIGNNIANINTIGFKGSRVNFQEALVQTQRGASRPSTSQGGTNPIQMGLGMQVASIDNLFQQGGVETTGQITDLAIQGEGFFILGDNYGNKFYTRAGAFGFDANANLVDPGTGLFVMGKMADVTGDIPALATTGRITLPFGQQDPAQSTTEIRLANNLDASATDSKATLLDDGTSGVISVEGTAADGVGGTHKIQITGAQPTRSNIESSVGGAGLNVLDRLGADLGVTDFSDIVISIDGGDRMETIQIDADTTVQGFMNAINSILGLAAELYDSGGGVMEMRISRTKAGDGANLNFQMDPIVAGDVWNTIFGAAAPGPLTVNNGVASTLQVFDEFTPNHGQGVAAGPVSSYLDLKFDEQTGLATEIIGLGGGGVTVKSGMSGLLPAGAGDELIITTDDTIHTSSIDIYDSLGERHTLSIQFAKSIIKQRWEWTCQMLGNEIITAGQNGYVEFGPQGELLGFGYYGGVEQLAIDPNNGSNNVFISFDPGTIFSYDGLTGFSGGGQHTASIVYQDGYGLGMLEKIAIDQEGNISGIFSNGITRRLAQISLAEFFNDAGLMKAGKSMYQVSANSGNAVEGTAGTTVAGTIFSGALESSAVDIAQEFTGMIITQRGFQANARVITTSDQMLDELVNIKR
jgi:flagellar hook protein FlgE